MRRSIRPDISGRSISIHPAAVRSFAPEKRSEPLMTWRQDKPGELGGREESENLLCDPVGENPTR